MTKRIVDENVIRWVVYERDRDCLYGFMRSSRCSGGLSAHHITKRSQLGDDVPENLITLCNWHHDMAEKRQIDPDDFRAILRELYGYDYGEKEEQTC